MADKVFKLEIVTPRKVVFSGDAMSFTAPGIIGSFQVLYNHAPLLAATGVGEVRLREAQGTEIRYASSGGFVDVLNNTVVMVAETAEHSDEIDIARAEAARERASERMAVPNPEIDLDRARVALARALNRISVARRG